MYKRSSPEALSLAALGRADSKRPDKTCRGITTAGKACRKPLKTGSREKYCHLHRDQSTTSQAKLLGAKTRTVTIIEELQEDPEWETQPQKTQPSNKMSRQYPAPLPTPSPSPQRRVSPSRKPVSTLLLTPEPQIRPPSLQLSPPPSISPPTPPMSINSPSGLTVKQRQKKGFFNLSKAFRKMFRPQLDSKLSPKTALQYPPLGSTFGRNELYPTRYPHTITPAGLPNSNPLTTFSSISGPVYPHAPQMLPPPARKPVSRPSTASTPNPPKQECRPPISVRAQPPIKTNGIQRSWETMWVPGMNGLGAHIICKEWLSPDLSAVGRQKLLTCMHAPLSIGEEPGYIYVYKISEDNSTKDVFYKVGRTQNLTRRLYQWSRSCPYTPLLVEFFPTPPASTLKRTSSSSSLSSLFRRETNGRPPVKMVKCAVTHRVERLIHLELEDRFGRVDISRGGCQCGKFHKEWFRGGSTGPRGWLEVRDVIARWVGFARIAYGEHID